MTKHMYQKKFKWRKKMTIGIDLDDTITDTSVYFTKLLSEYFNIDVDYLVNNKIYYINLPKELESKREEFEKYAFNKSIFQIPLKKNARSIINKMKKNGNKIIIITARDRKTFDNPNNKTKEQLDRLKINYDKIICTRDKVAACKKEKIDVMIDDSISNLKKLESQVKIRILFNSNYNKTREVEFIRFNTWKEIYNYLFSMFDG